MNKAYVWAVIILLLCSCVPDHEIRALYEAKPCPQHIILNSKVSVDEITCKEPEPITYVSSITLEKSIKFQKPKNDCDLIKELVPVKWEVAVFFDYNKSYLTQSAKNKLENNIWVLKNKPDMKISLRGYTDSRGSYSYNDALAKRRANSVNKYLRKHGISKKNIIIDPIGESLPLLKEVTEEDMATNRRVEMLLINEKLIPIPCIIMPNELKGKVQLKKIIEIDICALWKKKMIWHSGVEITSDLFQITQQNEQKLKANIDVLKDHPNYLVSLRNFSHNTKKKHHKAMNFIYDYLLKNQIDHDRIQLTKPTKNQNKNFNIENYCVELFLLDHKARPISLITTIKY